MNRGDPGPAAPSQKWVGAVHRRRRECGPTSIEKKQKRSQEVI